MIPLADGRVLAVGGADGCGVSASAAIYYPASNSWVLIDSMETPREFFGWIRMPDGRILVAGGTTSALLGFAAGSEVFDPVTSKWAAVGDMQSGRGSSCGDFAGPFVTPVTTTWGVGLAAGGLGGRCSAWPWSIRSAEVFSPVTLTWRAAAAMTTARSQTPLITLADGSIVVGGGVDAEGRALDSSERFDPARATWSAAATMNAARSRFGAALMADGNVLIVSGMRSLRGDGVRRDLSPLVNVGRSSPHRPANCQTAKARNGHNGVGFATSRVDCAVHSGRVEGGQMRIRIAMDLLRRGMSLRLLKFSGGSVDDYAICSRLLSGGKTELLVACAERSDQHRHVSIPLHPTEALHGFETPAATHRSIIWPRRHRLTLRFT